MLSRTFLFARRRLLLFPRYSTSAMAITESTLKEKLQKNLDATFVVRSTGTRFFLFPKAFPRTLKTFQEVAVLVLK